MAGRARKLTETDTAEWARFAQRIAPLPGKGGSVPAEIFADPPAGSPQHAAHDRAPRVEGAKSGTASRLAVGAQPAGVDAANWQRLRRGKLASARKLDLHGMTAQQAFHALRVFLHAAHADRLRCVEIVTGRGNGEQGGVLRREFASWLNLPDIRPLVLAAVHPHTSSALHAHVSNPGSVRLLLRRPRA
jgi:DNA-nicking Smr family endonuclease